jgi:uncharacterized membrane protein
VNRIIKIVLLVVVIGLTLAYFLGLYQSAHAPDPIVRTLLLTILAWQIFGIVALWRTGRVRFALILGFLILPLIYFQDHLKVLEPFSLLPNSLIYGGLGWVFGSSLRPRRTPLITVLATKIHGDLPEAIRIYTRRVTFAWTGYFVGTFALGVFLYYFVSFKAWSLFANIYSLPILLAMFLLEYAYRRWQFPWFEHVSMLAGVRAFMTNQQEERSERH